MTSIFWECKLLLHINTTIMIINIMCAFKCFIISWWKMDIHYWYNNLYIELWQSNGVTRWNTMTHLGRVIFYIYCFYRGKSACYSLCLWSNKVSVWLNGNEWTLVYVTLSSKKKILELEMKNRILIQSSYRSANFILIVKISF